MLTLLQHKEKCDYSMVMNWLERGDAAVLSIGLPRRNVGRKSRCRRPVPARARLSTIPPLFSALPRDSAPLRPAYVGALRQAWRCLDLRCAEIPRGACCSAGCNPAALEWAVCPRAPGNAAKEPVRI